LCKHCGSNAGEKYFDDELTTEEIKKTFQEIADNLNAKKIMLAITGGEPLLRKDLFEVMRFARDLGFSWGIVTNGYLVDEDIVKKMGESGMKSIVISIDEIGRAHDDFRGKEGAYDRAINAVKLLAKAEFPKILQITTTIHQGNIDSLDEMRDVFLQLGINSWRIMNVDPIGRVEKNKELLLNKEQFQRMLQFIKDTRKSSKIEITYDCSGFLGLEFEGEVRDNYFFCPTGINIASILHNGDIFVCPNVPRRQELIQGNIRKYKFSEVWNNKFEIFRKKDRTKCDKCSKCDFWNECLGNSFHLWDFEKNEPKICHWEMINNI